MSSHGTSAAEPHILLEYAKTGFELCGQERQLARELAPLLEYVAATCTEYAINLAEFNLVNRINRSANETEDYHDRWLHDVAMAFLRADNPELGSMVDLARMLENIPHPITIYELESGEYLILLEGTGGRGIYHDWAGAIESGLGLPGDYERHVMDFINDMLPAGATLHFAGHSQGGIVANNLADNQDFLDRFDVATVTTFGSPVSARPNPDVVYTRFRNATDPVPLLDPELVYRSTRNKAWLEYLGQTPLDSGAELVSAHKMSEYIQALEDAGLTNLPSGLSGGNLTEVASSDSSRDSTATEDALFRRFAPIFVPADIVVDTSRGLVVHSLNRLVDWMVDVLPEPIADEVDRYRDRINHKVMSLPNATEATGAVIDAIVGNTIETVGEIREMGEAVVEEAVEYGGDVLGGAVDFGGDVVDFGGDVVDFGGDVFPWP